MKTKELTIGALLSAMAILIPLVFGGFLTIMIPPFTATLMSHVPLFFAMLISPQVALMVGLTSAMGFFIRLGVVVGMRGMVHVVVGFLGAYLIKKGYKFHTALLICLPVHAILEGIVVLPFAGYGVYKALVVVGVGTAIHHLIDSAIAIFLATAVARGYKFSKQL